MNTPAPVAYGPQIYALLVPARLNPLDAGQPNHAARDLLNVPVETLFQPCVVRDRAAATACRAGLWLYHDFVEEAHAVSQELETPEGSYWHALVRRREPDFGNLK